MMMRMVMEAVEVFYSGDACDCVRVVMVVRWQSGCYDSGQEMMIVVVV